jgi:hypothetical protein
LIVTHVIGQQKHQPGVDLGTLFGCQVAIREILNRALRAMDLLFESIYGERGRYSVPPEWLLRGRKKVSDGFTLAMLAVNLRRLPRLFAEQAALAGSG